MYCTFDILIRRSLPASLCTIRYIIYLLVHAPAFVTFREQTYTCTIVYLPVTNIHMYFFQFLFQIKSKGVY